MDIYRRVYKGFNKFNYLLYNVYIIIKEACYIKVKVFKKIAEEIKDKKFKLL